MEVFMDFYFDSIFSNKERTCLSERYKRRELVKYFSTVIAGCSRGQDINDSSTCRQMIVSILKHHNKWKDKNGGVCRMGKYHDILYVAIKVAFDWSLQDNSTVASLLDEIYNCERTFERIFLGAIFGTSAPYYIAGWKSEFQDREENLHALVFFLDHATNANVEYKTDHHNTRFIDVPLESCGMVSPLRIVIQMGSSEMTSLLLRFGARITHDTNSTDPVESILERLLENKRRYTFELVACLRVILRTIPTIKLHIDRSQYKHLKLPEDYNYQRRIILEKYPELLEDHLIPSSRCGLRPPELKHLCRCSVRYELWKNFQLPFGIRKLNIPEKLMRYIDICED